MSLALVEDYLRTQGLRLPVDAVRMAHLAAQAVVDLGQAEIDRELLRAFEGADDLLCNEEAERAVKQVFMALDAACGRADMQSAAVYAMPSEKSVLLRVAQQGVPIEAVLPADDVAAECFVAVRTAQTGWLNLIDDAAAWYADAGMPSENLRCGSVMSLPVCLESGRVVGVLHVEAARSFAFDEESQASWVGLALALIGPLRVLSGVQEQNDEE